MVLIFWGNCVDSEESGLHVWIRVIHQGTVDNNLGPVRLEGPKALDPIIADNQLFDFTTFIWKS